MFKAKKAIALFMTLVSALGAVPAYAVEYVTIADIREETKEGWHEAYEAHGRTINVSINVDIPSASKMPIVRVGLYDPLNPPQGISSFEAYPASIYVNNYVEVCEKTDAYIDTYIMPDNQAENNPLSPTEAESVARTIFAYHEDITGNIDLNLIGITGHSRHYVDNAGADGVQHDFDFTKPKSQMGCYEIYFEQLIHGVPIVNTGLAYKTVVHAKGELYAGYLRPSGESSIMLYSPDNYVYTFSPVQVGEILIEDAPIIPFETALAKFEEYINQGYVRKVYSARLGYMVFDNPGYDDFILKPVWMMSCYVEQERDKEFPDSDDELSTYMAYAGFGIAVDAQTGEVYKPYTIPQDKVALEPGNLLSWDDVK